MDKLLKFFAYRPIAAIFAAIVIAAFGWNYSRNLPVDVFPDIPVPRVVIQTEAPGFTAEEVEERITIPIEAVMNGIPGISTIRSSSSGGLSFVWVEFDWQVDLNRARFDVFERLQRIRASLPEGADAEIAPLVSVTGEIMLVALTSAKTNGASPLELREIAEYELRPRLLSERGVGEVVVLGGRLPEYRISVAPRKLAQYNLSIDDVIDAVRDTRTYASAGYLASVKGDEIPLRQVARADTLESIKRSPVIVDGTGALRLDDVADVSLSGTPRRGSASFNGREAVIVSIQKSPGGNTPEITARLDKVVEDFRVFAQTKGIVLHTNAYRQADFINVSVSGAARVVRDAAAVVLIVLVLTLFRVRTILVVLLSMALTLPVSLALFPVLGLGINVITLGGFAVAAGDIVDAAIIFAEVVWRRKDLSIVAAMKSVAPGVAFSTLTVAIVFVPLLLLSGLEGAFFRPLSLAYLTVFLTSLIVAFAMVPALSKLLGRDRGKLEQAQVASDSFGVKVMKAVYKPFLGFSMRFPIVVILVALIACGGATRLAMQFGSSFLPSFHEDSFNVILSLPPGASLNETERVAEACVKGILDIKGVKSVVRRTGRAERDQHAEPVSSSEYVVRVDMNGDVEGVRNSIRALLKDIPGCSSMVSYPIAHRISAVLSGTESEVAVNVYGENIDSLREVVAKMKARLDLMDDVSDVRANREVTVRTLRIEYNLEALAEIGLTLREAGEQVSAAFNGIEAGEVRDGLKSRAVTVRLEGFDEDLQPHDVARFLLTTRTGRRIKLEDVAKIYPDDASDLMLREGGRRKALISLNAAPHVDTGTLVKKLQKALDPLAEAEGMNVEYGGTHEARQSAASRLGVLAVVLVIVIFFLLFAALKSGVSALLALLNVPLALIGGVVAVWMTNPVLSVSSLVGFITVSGFVLRNGILLLQRYRDLEAEGCDVVTAVREGSLERMAPILMTSLTTVLGLIPIILAGDKPGGELLAPLAIVQFGGILGASALNLMVLPAAALLVGKIKECKMKKAGNAALMSAVAFTASMMIGCKSYEANPIDWTAEKNSWATNNVFQFSSLDDVAAVAMIGNPQLNRLRIARANSERVALETGWWEDPELDFDLMRIVNPADHPFLGGGAVKFAIPLSGVPKLEELAAKAYARAAADEIIAEEREVAAAARMAAVRLMSSRRVAQILQQFESDETIEGAFKSAEDLVKSGELSMIDLASAKRRRHARIHQLRAAENAADEAESALRKLLGVAPGTQFNFNNTSQLGLSQFGSIGCVHTSMPPAVAALDFTRHPKVKAALHKFEGGELALKKEIHRQYPDLKIGPQYVNEEGLDRIGIAAGIQLPLWNRNRAGIAGAEGERDMLRWEAIVIWREIIEDVASARRKLKLLLDHQPEQCIRSAKEVNALKEAGEMDVLSFLSAREDILEAECAELEWKRDICLVSEELAKNHLEEEAR